MKLLSSFLLLFLFATSYAKPTTYDGLVEINKCWQEQNDLPSLATLSTTGYSDRDWIKLHLSLVEQTLRNRSTAQLSASQRANRNTALDRLNEYWQQGNFPVNDKYAYRTPIFIDEYNNFCAVGYLMKATGFENISRKVAANTNLAYVREMNYPELNVWAKDFGFTADELAWIQPGYGPIGNCGTEAIGKGTNGEVQELFVNATGDKLYVGGSFTQVDSSVNANNIAYTTESNGVYQWHSLGGGVNGPVYAIEEFQGKIFVGGSFTMAGNTPVSNVAYWDGAAWNSAGCIYGTIKDFIVFNNELYTVGDFDVCASASEVNFAKWNGTMWGQTPHLDGYVNTIEERNGSLLLGGNFTWANQPENIIKWTPANGFETYNTGIANEVMDIGIYNDTVYAVCKRTSATDSNLIQTLSGNNWVEFSGNIDNTISQASPAGFYTFCAQADTVMLGGDFEFWGMFDPNYSNSMNLYDIPKGIGSQGNWFMVDDAVNTMVVYKGSLVFGGKFKTGMNNFMTTQLNYIGKKAPYKTTKTDDVMKKKLVLFPNPATSNSIIKIDNTMNAKHYLLRSINGAKIAEKTQNAAITEIQLPELVSGTYFIEISNDKGERGSQMLLIK
ncbi:MAG TPA: T9SS type A sorting domain-containing protein [Flavipsychrobacter sp.]|nr:T9SS type A sorting domain-containing protein [Flavipsychrobacter sp.]